MISRLSFICITCIVFLVSVSVASPWSPDTKNLEKVPEHKIIKDVRQYLRSTDGNTDGTNNDPNDFMTYYKLRTFQNMRKALPRAMPMDWFRGVMTNAINDGIKKLRYDPETDRDHLLGGGRFSGGNCNCSGTICICCSELNLFGLDNKTCTRLEYNPKTSTVNMDVKTENHFHHNSFHVSKAKTKCVPIAVPYLEAGFLDLCMGFYNVSEPHEGLLHLCMVANGRIKKQTFLTLFYDCVDMGVNPPPQKVYQYPVVNKPGPFYYKFPSTSAAPPSGEEPWTPPPKKKIGFHENQKGSYGYKHRNQGNFDGVQELTAFLAKWIF